MVEFDSSELLQELDEAKKKDAVRNKERFQHFYDGFWEFQKYMDSSERSGYADDQLDVKLVSFALYLLIWGYVDKMVLSMPRRRRKSHSVNDAVKYVVGYMPTRSNARYSYAESLVKKHSGFIRDEIKSPKFQAIFPDVKLKVGNTSLIEWKVEQCKGEPTFHCSGVGGGATGNGVNKLLIADDLVKGWKEANSPVEKDNVDTFVEGNMVSSEEAGMCTLHVATRWTDEDPPGVFLNDAKIGGHRIFLFDAYETKLTDENIHNFIKSVVKAEPTNNDVLHITIPALDKDDETTCPYHEKYTTEYYRGVREKLKKKGLEHIWYSMYQQDPRRKGSLLFNDFKNFYYLEDSAKMRFSGAVSHLDPAGKGRNNTCVGLARVMGDNVYIDPTIVYTPEKPEISKLEILEFMKKFDKTIDMITGEGNGGGDQFCESLNELFEENEIENRIDIINSAQNKELKIFLDSDWINKHVYLPAEYDRKGERQYEIDSPMYRCINALTKYIGKVNGSFVRNQEDDFLDFLCGVKDLVQDKDEGFECSFL